MSEDALKTLLQADSPVSPPARDIAFVIAVMERVERRRLFESLAWWVGGGCAVILVMAVVMPYLTPALISLGDALVPATVILSVISMMAVGVWYLRPALRDFGIRI